LARQLCPIERFSGIGAALKFAKYGDDLEVGLLTALAAKWWKKAPENEFLSSSVDREDSVRLSLNLTISMG